MLLGCAARAGAGPVALRPRPTPALQPYTLYPPTHPPTPRHPPPLPFRPAAQHYTKADQRMPLILVRLYTYQMLRALAHTHGEGVCHRDIKPQHLLVNVNTHALKLCDFGSAKRLVPGEPNISYICSRCAGAGAGRRMGGRWSRGGRPLLPARPRTLGLSVSPSQVEIKEVFFSVTHPTPLLPGTTAPRSSSLARQTTPPPSTSGAWGARRRPRRRRSCSVAAPPLLPAPHPALPGVDTPDGS